MKASNNATSETVARADMYAVVDRKGKSKETKVSTNSEYSFFMPVVEKSPTKNSHQTHSHVFVTRSPRPYLSVRLIYLKIGSIRKRNNIAQFRE